MGQEFHAYDSLPADVRGLVDGAREVARRAHAPYSGFHVGAALRSEDGRVFTGCNVENASYGLTICAERNAMTSAVAAGARRFDTIALYAPTPTPSVPCGACRQFLAEFAPSLTLWIACDTAKLRTCSLAELFPQPFLAGELEVPGREDGQGEAEGQAHA